jgi:hypothetical protein
MSLCCSVVKYANLLVAADRYFLRQNGITIHMKQRDRQVHHHVIENLNPTATSERSAICRSLAEFCQEYNNVLRRN